MLISIKTSFFVCVRAWSKTINVNFNQIQLFCTCMCLSMVKNN